MQLSFSLGVVLSTAFVLLQLIYLWFLRCFRIQHSLLVVLVNCCFVAGEYLVAMQRCWIRCRQSSLIHCRQGHFCRYVVLVVITLLSGIFVTWLFISSLLLWWGPWFGCWLHGESYLSWSVMFSAATVPVISWNLGTAADSLLNEIPQISCSTYFSIQVRSANHECLYVIPVPRYLMRFLINVNR